jgi:hypothetical protein
MKGILSSDITRIIYLFHIANQFISARYADRLSLRCDAGAKRENKSKRKKENMSGNGTKGAAASGERGYLGMSVSRHGAIKVPGTKVLPYYEAASVN